MSYPHSKSLLQPRINSQLSTQIIIKVDDVSVGAIQQLQVNQNKNMVYEEEIGTDGIIEIHPQGAAKIDLTVQRIAFDKLRITESFARGFINIQAQRIPFNIQVMDLTDSIVNSKNVVVHEFHNCWFKVYNSTLTVNNYLIMENVNIACEYVTSSVDGINASYGGLRGINYIFDSVERKTDLIGKRGRLDSSGMVSRK